MREKISEEKHRLFLLDIIKVICAVLVYMRHSITMYGCTYGVARNDFIMKATYPIMTCFFVMSGFSTHYQHRKDELTSAWTRTYLKKRLITILPSYLLVVMVYPLIRPSQVKDWLKLLPVDLLGIQTSYNTLFGILHNGVTWFISCLLFCYFIYPIIKAVLDLGKRYIAVLLMLIPYIILMYNIYLVPAFELSRVYSNPIFRAAEFIVGAAFADILMASKEKRRDIEKPSKWMTRVLHWSGWLSAGLIAILCVISTFIAKFDHINAINSAKRFHEIYLVIPPMLVLILISCYVRCGFLEKSRVLAMLSGVSLQFYLTQVYLWDISPWLLKMFKLEIRNRNKILVSFFACFFISLVVWGLIDRPIRKFLKKYLLVSKKQNKKLSSDVSEG